MNGIPNKATNIVTMDTTAIGITVHDIARYAVSSYRNRGGPSPPYYVRRGHHTLE